MGAPTAAEQGWLPRAVAAALLAVLGLILLQQTADKIDGRLVLLGDRLWPGYALELRNDPVPPACDLEAARQAEATCVQAPAAAPPASDDPFGTPPDADPFGTPPDADPFGTPEGADPFGTPEGADPFGTPEGADPFAEPSAAAAQGVPCVAAQALVQQCAAEHQAHQAAVARLTGAVRAFRAVELFFRDLANFAYGIHLLSVVLLLGGLQATWLRAHINLAPVRRRIDHQVSQGAQLLAHLLLSASAVADWQVKAALQMEVDNVEIPVLWAVGFGLLAVVNAWHMARPPSELRPGGSASGALLGVPLYTWMVVLAGAWFLLGEAHPSGLAIHLHKFAQIPSVYLAVALYVWSGMLLERTRISAQVFDLIRPWKLPVALLAWVVVVAAALPTAYSGASGIFVIATGALVFEELRRAGATTQQARMVTAMSGSLGVVLRPCLIVVLVASLNKEVTTDQLYESGAAVFLLTAAVFLVVLLAVYRPRLSLAPISQALPDSLAAAGRLAPAVLIGAAVVALYAFGLDAPLNERTAPWILPILLALVLLWERRAERGQPDATTTPRKVFRATLMTGEHVGALLFLMAATVALGGVVERAEVMSLVPATFGSPLATMGVLVVIMVLVGMTMDPMGAVILVSVTVADIAYKGGIDPVHFWMMVLVAFELGYLTPPVALNQLLARQVVGDAADVVPTPGMGFFQRHEHVIVPMIVMGISLLLVAFVPLLWSQG
ncbi:TRAP transporter large permease subunit [Myxococcota bacterium]|nr:TRAP transporter large permease subunit [Myxococcota bacterium]